MLETIQMGMPYMGNGRAPVGKVGVVRTSQPVIKTPSPSFHIPKTQPTGSVSYRPNTRVLTAQEEKQAQRRANQLQRQADRQARREARRNRPSYFERHGETRLTTILNGLSDVVGGVTSIADMINTVRQNGSYYRDENGVAQPLTQEDKEVLSDYFQSQQAQGMDFQTMMAMIQANQKKDNTALYIGLGVGALVLVALVMMMNKK